MYSITSQNYSIQGIAKIVEIGDQSVLGLMTESEESRRTKAYTHEGSHTM